MVMVMTMVMMTMLTMTMVMIMTTKVNTMAVMEATEVVMERMSGRGGLIVNTASLAGASSIIHVEDEDLDLLESKSTHCCEHCFFDKLA